MSFSIDNSSIAVQRKNDERSKKRMCAVEGTLFLISSSEARRERDGILACFCVIRFVHTHLCE